MTRAAQIFAPNRPQWFTITRTRDGSVVATVYAYTFARAVNAYTLRKFGRYATQFEILDAYDPAR